MKCREGIVPPVLLDLKTISGPVAGINFVSLEQLDRQERNLFDPRHFCGYDSDAVEVFAVTAHRSA